MGARNLIDFHQGGPVAATAMHFYSLSERLIASGPGIHQQHGIGF
jgi:hypothetical protein